MSQIRSDTGAASHSTSRGCEARAQVSDSHAAKHAAEADGRVPLDTNLVENVIRPFVLDRKNWLFADTARGAEASANLYSLVENAKANALDPTAYLRYVFTHLPAAPRPDRAPAPASRRSREARADAQHAELTGITDRLPTARFNARLVNRRSATTDLHSHLADRLK